MPGFLFSKQSRDSRKTLETPSARARTEALTRSNQEIVESHPLYLVTVDSNYNLVDVKQSRDSRK